MNKVIVIGANSYIARNTIYVLKEKYPNVSVKLYDWQEKQIDGWRNYSSINVLNTESLKKIDFDCSIVFMFVGKTGSVNGFDDFNTFIDVNERSLLNILNEYRRQGSYAKIIFPSTRLVYRGKPGLQSEDAEKEFKTIYAINKFACEQYLEQYHRVYDVQYCIFRICIPYGTMISDASSYGTAEFMISKAQNGKKIQLYGDGSVRRTLTYIEDLCHVLIEGAFSDECKNDIFNIGGENYSLKEMAILIAEKYGVDIEFVKYPDIALKIETGDTVFDDKKLQKICPYNFEGRYRKWVMEIERNERTVKREY